MDQENYNEQNYNNDDNNVEMDEYDNYPYGNNEME